MLLIHIGAGRHSLLLDAKYKKLLRNALLVDFSAASQIIEKSPLTNTGYGSSLDHDGNASCDCTYSTINLGKVEELLSLTNIGTCATPTLACELIVQSLASIYHRGIAHGSARGILGLLKPSSMEFESARKLCLIVVDELVLKHTRLLYERYMENERQLEALIDRKLREEETRDGMEEVINGDTEDQGLNSENLDNTNESILRQHRLDVSQSVQDTVGLLETGDSIKMSTSSGGAFLRPPGRVSCAGVYGAGSGFGRVGDTMVMCFCSGNGDDIVKMALASHISDRLARIVNEEWTELGPTLVDIVRERSTICQLQAVDENLNSIVYVGVVAVVKQHNKLRVVYCHSTETFYFGFRGQTGTEIVLSKHNKPGTFVCGEYRA